ncbi:PEP/pyruvate-binding domain-containing protein [Arthrobacter sp. OVS8]|nr:PEP/pyruvate-binding domain-containing protein [Arthrobacter sp. OVS8]
MDSTQKAPEDPLVLDLRGTGTAPLRLVGGKALNLGKLVAAGLPVPRGFCLTTAAYELAAPPDSAPSPPTSTRPGPERRTRRRAPLAPLPDRPGG